MRKLAILAALSALAGAGYGDALKPDVIIHAPGAFTFSVTFVNDQPVLGVPKSAKIGAGVAEDGEILISVLPSGLAPYAKFTVVEKTPRPVDFVITGLIDTIKIDEVEVCGRLGAVIAGKIAAGAHRLSLNRFAPQKDGASCP